MKKNSYFVMEKTINLLAIIFEFYEFLSNTSPFLYTYGEFSNYN